jgi:ComF family protein
MHWIQRLRPLADLVLQSACPLCDRPSSQGLCLDCDRQLQQDRLQKPLGSGTVPVLAWGAYGGTLRQAIAAMKYGQHPELARPLGHHLATLWETSTLAKHHPRPVVIPVPMHDQKQRERGFNQAELIARAFCERTTLPLKPMAVTRTRNTQPLFSLSPTDREAVLKDAFGLSDAVRKRPPTAVLLVDDIYTTGATLRAIHRVLRQHRVHLCGLAVVARASDGGDSPRETRSDR